MSQVRWLAPSPLWDDLLGNPSAFRAPALLRFVGDEFMPEFQGVLEKAPKTLRGYVARPETWRAPAAGMDAPATGTLRLYQPVHGRFYLAAASLACRVPGLPEHTVDAAKGEIVAFVVRRITTTVDENTQVVTETGEYGWVKRVDGREGWVRVTGATLVTDEEQHPMFGTSFTDAEKRMRRVFAGLVPVSRREGFVSGGELPAAAGPAIPPAAGSLDDPRVIDFQGRFLDPLVELKEWYDLQKVDDARRGPALEAAEQSAGAMLLDLHDFLRDELEPIWDVMKGTRAATTLPDGQRTLHTRLSALGVYKSDATGRATLLDAALHAAAHRGDLESLGVSTPQVWPELYVPRVLIGDPRDPDTSPLADPAVNDDEARLVALLVRRSTPEEAEGLGVREIKALVMGALAEAGAAPVVQAEQLPSRSPANAQGDDWFVVRCVYLRPNCGRLEPPRMSERSERFQLASFFEPEAPARHLHVALPVDTSPATLRKYNRNVTFMLSDELRKQMSRAASLKDLSEGKAGSVGSGLDLAVICSFSLPIITICALILLMIIVSLLNIIFWWLPLFKICFPLPSLKAKG